MIRTASITGSVAALIACGSCSPAGGYSAATPSWVSDTSAFVPASIPAPSVADAYRTIATRIIAAARSDASGGAYAKLAVLTDTIGHRLSGSAALDKAIAWAAQAMKDDGLEVRTEPVTVPHWVRGSADAAMIAPVARPLHVLALGSSVATPRGGITAPVVVVHDWKELEQKRDQLKGAIVLFNVKMPAWSDAHGSGYGTVVEYRWAAASRAGKLGAAAVLVRSVTARSLDTPHTGNMGYDKDDKSAPRIPAASVTIEDADLLERLAADARVQVRLRLDTQQLPDAVSANVIGELRGRDKPDEIVVIGAHIDSWDVGQGAHDDGAGCVTMMQALRVLKQLGLQPRRTIRVVLFTNEENGLRGGKTYAEAHAAELPKTVFALEADSGGFAPLGFDIDHKDPEAAKRMRGRLLEIAALLDDVGATRVDMDGGGADIGPMKPAGVPLAGLLVDGRSYFDVHHTAADTLDKVKASDLNEMVAAVAVLAYVVADLPARVDAP